MQGGRYSEMSVNTFKRKKCVMLHSGGKAIQGRWVFKVGRVPPPTVCLAKGAWVQPNAIKGSKAQRTVSP